MAEIETYVIVLTYNEVDNIEELLTQLYLWRMETVDAFNIEPSYL